ncbi:cholinesterase 1-like isoform X1 [Varroa jacobsoni]|uniref:cholinesterase 1-like isoform X1 n=1 Tax=Varroa jacobsoni TaxID=62625 RepID=UPI000BF3BF71|nr:cholinesterase 1-like isoform X1 [Varroa jacobsoni]
MLRLIFALLIAIPLTATTPTANLTSGLWNGIEIDIPDVPRKVEAFLGVRYAKPPLGNLRFKHPKPHAYSGEQDGTKLADACIQGNTFYIRKGINFHFESTSEDCLHVNIYRPKGVTDAPVVVYVYGGSFLGGFNGLFLYDPEELVARHDIIVVIINYRLSVMGFLFLNNTEAPGNQGLHDILLAVKFVKENARALNGDPDKFTLWGQSAGAFAVGFLMGSPLAKGLFSRVILQSGTPVSAAPSFSMNSINGAVSAASVVNCIDSSRKPEDQLEDIGRCIKNVDAKTLFDAVNRGLGEHYTITFQPQYGIDNLLPDFPFPTDQSKVPLNDDIKEVFTSTVSNEGGLFIEGILERFQFNDTSSADDYIDLARIVMKVILNLPVELVRDSSIAYIPQTLQVGHNLRSAMGRLFGDLIFECPTDLYSAFLANRGVKVYRYVWNQRPLTSYWPEWTGATHCDDVPYTMGGQLHLGEKAERSNQASPELARYMRVPIDGDHKTLVLNSLKMIADFIKNGIPSRPDGTDWPLYTPTEPRMLRIEASGFTEITGPRSDKCSVWDDYLHNIVAVKKPGSTFDFSGNNAIPQKNTVSRRPQKFKKLRTTSAATPAQIVPSTMVIHSVSLIGLILLLKQKVLW